MTQALRAAALTASLLVAAAASAEPVPSSSMPGPLKEVRYEQRIGTRIPPDITFFDEAGRAMRTGELFAKRPAILVMAYYHCPMLCDMVLESVQGSLKPLALDPGRDFDVVVVSIDPRENPQIARRKKAEIVRSYDRPGTEGGWHFLTGTEKEIERLAATVGFHYVPDPANDQFAHAAGLVMVTPGGTISRYLFGIEFAPRDVKLGLIESASGKLGNVVDQILLYCFHYDPVTGRYSAVTLRIVRIAAVATLIGIVLMVALLRRRETAAPGPLGAA